MVFFGLSNMAHSLKNVCEIILDWASEGLEKSLVGAVNKQEKEETETESVSGDLKNTQTGTNLRTVDHLRCKFVIFLILLFCSLYKTNGIPFCRVSVQSKITEDVKMF